MAGELCGAAPGRTVHVLLSGITYDRTYWDFPYKRETYSYVKHLNNAGYATLNLDPLGTGASDVPPALEVTQSNAAAAVDQWIQGLRRGDFGGVIFKKVILVGHSAGALLAPTVAATYDDADGVIITGVDKGFAASTGALELFTLQTIPTFLDPELSKRNYPLGYLTTRPGSRGQLFYDPKTSDPAVIARDEKTKGAWPAALLVTAAETLIRPIGLKAPVFVVVGDRDRPACGLLPCSSPLNPFQLERSFFPKVASYDQLIIPETGHDLNLSTTAPQFYEAVARWSDETVGR